MEDFSTYSISVVKFRACGLALYCFYLHPRKNWLSNLTSLILHLQLSLHLGSHIQHLMKVTTSLQQPVPYIGVQTWIHAITDLAT